MKHLLIIGARGYGRGLYDIVKDMPGFGSAFDVKGYLDSDKNILGHYNNYPPIIDSVENYLPQDDDVFACALGDVKWKKHYVDIILSKGGCFMNIIHPSAHLGSNVKLGKGCVVGYNAQIDCDARIGDFVNIQTDVVVGHDTVIGNWSILDCFSFMGGFSEIGDSVTMHTRATLIPNKKVGDGCIVNACSLVIRDAGNNVVLMGSPAKPLILPKVDK